jgi:hypothetical protein
MSSFDIEVMRTPSLRKVISSFAVDAVEPLAAATGAGLADADAEAHGGQSEPGEAQPKTTQTAAIQGRTGSG